MKTKVLCECSFLNSWQKFLCWIGLMSLPSHLNIDSVLILLVVGLGLLSLFVCFLKLLYCLITVVCIFSPPLYPTPAKPTSLPCFHHPLWFCPCVLYSSSCKPLSPLSLPPSPLVIVRLFLTSMSLVIFCLLFSFVDYVPAVRPFL